MHSLFFFKCVEIHTGSPERKNSSEVNSMRAAFCRVHGERGGGGRTEREEIRIDNVRQYAWVWYSEMTIIKGRPVSQ